MSKRQKGPSVVREGVEMTPNPVHTELSPPVLTNAIQTIFPVGSRVVALFEIGAVIELCSGEIQWSSFLPHNRSQITTFKGRFLLNPNLLQARQLKDTNVSILVSVIHDSRIVIWSCETGEAIYTQTSPVVGKVTHIQLSELWLVLAFDNGPKTGKTSFVCCPWQHKALFPDFHFTIMKDISIAKVSQLIFDQTRENVCWILSASGVFSFDVSLPQSIIAPIKVMLDPLRDKWHWDMDYRLLVFDFYTATNQYHSLTTDEKLKFIHENVNNCCSSTVQSLREYPHTALANENIPIAMTHMELNEEERIVFTPSFAAVINMATKKVFCFPIPETIAALHICVGTFMLITPSAEVTLITVSGGDVSTTSITLPHTESIRDIYHNKCIVHIDNSVYTHMRSNIIYTLDVNTDSTKIAVTI
jgi:hypothetical protein